MKNFKDNEHIGIITTDNEFILSILDNFKNIKGADIESEIELNIQKYNGKETGFTSFGGGRSSYTKSIEKLNSGHANNNLLWYLNYPNNPGLYAK